MKSTHRAAWGEVKILFLLRISQMWLMHFAGWQASPDMNQIQMCYSYSVRCWFIAQHLQWKKQQQQNYAGLKMLFLPLLWESVMCFCTIMKLPEKCFYASSSAFRQFTVKWIQLNFTTSCWMFMKVCGPCCQVYPRPFSDGKYVTRSKRQN